MMEQRIEQDNKTIVDSLQEIAEEICDSICRWQRDANLYGATDAWMNEKCGKCPLRKLL